MLPRAALLMAIAEYSKGKLTLEGDGDKKDSIIHLGGLRWPVSRSRI